MARLSVSAKIFTLDACLVQIMLAIIMHDIFITVDVFSGTSARVGSKSIIIIYDCSLLHVGLLHQSHASSI